LLDLWVKSPRQSVVYIDFLKNFKVNLRDSLDKSLHKNNLKAAVVVEEVGVVGWGGGPAQEDVVVGQVDRFVQLYSGEVQSDRWQSRLGNPFLVVGVRLDLSSLGRVVMLRKEE